MAESKSKKAEGLTYKGHPLRRVDNLIYYGTMAEKYIIMMQILNTKKEQDMEDGHRHRLAGPGSCRQAVRNRTFSPALQKTDERNVHL